MKKIIALTVLSALLAIGFQPGVQAQESTDKYTQYFKKALLNLDSSWMSPAKMQETANQFERLANNKKTDWLAYYYHALCLIQLSFMSDAETREANLKAAEASIKAATALSKDNVEIVTLEGYLYQGMIMINPMANGAIYGPKSAMTLQKAMAMDASNPRAPYLLGQNTYFTPEQWGGGMERARPYLEKAKALFEAFKPASELHPNWGYVPCVMILEGKMK